MRSRDRSALPGGRGRTWRTATIASFVLSGLILAAAFYAPEEGATRAKRFDVPAAILRCEADAECELVDKIGCCSCKSGGARWAINRTQEDALRLFLKRTCRHRTVCVQLDSCPDDLAPACVAGRCAAQIAPREEPEPRAPSASAESLNHG